MKYRAIASWVAAAVMVATAAVPGSPESQQGAARFEQPLLITSAGQNAEVQIAAVLAKRAVLDYTLSKLAGPKDLAGMKTLALVLGTSLKGLGAAGLDVDKENARVEALVAEAGKTKTPVLCLHLGGEGRRGQQTDDLMAKLLPLARLVIVVKSGNADGFFTKICQAANIPLIEVEKTADAQAALLQAFTQ
jgi:hypothetical protein